MAADTWYVRVRGKIAGPYPLDQLQTLRKRRQLGRAHEISVDGQTWESAGTLSELFPEIIKPIAPNPLTEVQPVLNLEDEPMPELEYEPMPELEPVVGAPQVQAPASQPQWYYANQGQQSGPISDSDLARLVANGEVLSETLVWREGMQEWLPVHSIPGLIGGSQIGGVQGASPVQTQPHTYPNQGYPQQTQVEPHRAELILTLGIVGLFIPIVGVAAWIMGHSDLQKIKRGAMDPTGEGKTKTGMILGIIDTVWMAIAIISVAGS